jgi:hypothetical protein
MKMRTEDDDQAVRSLLLAELSIIFSNDMEEVKEY